MKRNSALFLIVPLTLAALGVSCRCDCEGYATQAEMDQLRQVLDGHRQASQAWAQRVENAFACLEGLPNCTPVDPPSVPPPNSEW